MNAGLSNLATLKAWLLTAAMRPGTDYDEQILAIGRGVALQLERHCNRKFARVVGDTYTLTGGREVIIVPRFPLEAVTKVETRETIAEGWAEEVATIVDLFTAESGVVHFASRLGYDRGQIRVTFTGGFWWSILEPDDEEDDEQPENSATVPDDLLLAWQLQCEHVWTQRDKLGLAIAEKPSQLGALAKIELLPIVVDHLRNFVRYALT